MLSFFWNKVPRHQKIVEARMGVLDDRITELEENVAAMKVAVDAAIAALGKPTITTEQEEALARLGITLRDATEDLTTAVGKTAG